jgi:hypothetical protein
MIDNHNLELKVYDMLGYNYYLIGDVQKAQYFHHKSITGFIEDNELLAKKTCVENLREIESIKNGKSKSMKDRFVKDVCFNLIHTLGMRQDFIEKGKFQSVLTLF